MGELLIVEDDPHTRSGLKQFLEDIGWTVREAGSFEAALEDVRCRKPDAVVTDIVIPREASVQRGSLGERVGLELVAEVKSCWPEVAVVIFSAHSDHGDAVLEFLQRGVRGLACLVKGAGVDEFEMALRQATWGGVYLDPAIRFRRRTSVQGVVGQLTPLEQRIIDRGRRLLASLTPREVEIASLMAASRSTAQIAEELSLTAGTVHNHVTNIYGKLQLLPAEDGVKLRRDVLLSKLWLIATLEGEPALARNMEPCQSADPLIGGIHHRT